MNSEVHYNYHNDVILEQYYMYWYMKSTQIFLVN